MKMSVERVKRIEEKKEKITAELTKNVEKHLQELRDRWMEKGKDLMDEIPLCLPPWREVNHRIPIIDKNMKYQYHRSRCPDALKQVLNTKISRYMEAKWWVETSTDQAAPMLCILKKDGRLRTVIDLRKRNANTHRDVTPFPDQDQIRMDVARAQFRSKIDMSDAYEQIRIVEEDISKTAFATVYGTYLSTVMQQGDCNAPSTFQRLMTHIFRDYIAHFVHVYLDDIFVYSDTIEEHERHLDLVFNRLRENKMYLSRKKCDLYSKRMDCLGHIIDDDGLHADGDKMAKIRAWRTPRDFGDVQRFLGLVTYLAPFMPNVSAYTGPLAAIVRDKRAFVWRPLHDKCFESIKAIACKSPILRPIDPKVDETIWVICDASTSGVGALYGQGPDWKTCRPAGFMSKKFTTAQHVYATFEHETLAILEALLKWEDKLLGWPIHIITDHKSLEFFNTQRHLSDRQIRWMIYLSRFNYKITYVKGETNIVADCFSRYYKTDNWDEMQPMEHLVNADARLDEHGASLPVERFMELRELAEERHREAEELAQAQETTENEEEVPTTDDDPMALESAVVGPPLRPMVEEGSNFLDVVKKGYAIDPLFRKIKERPSDYRKFEVKDGLIWSKNHIGEPVLCVPRAKSGERSTVEIVIDQAHIALGHLGSRKTRDYIRRWYWWPKLVPDVDAFCITCATCQMAKSIPQLPAGLLHSMPIPTRPWSSIGMDFVGPFPQSMGFDYLWVVICRMTGMVHLIPCTTRVRASELAWKFLAEIVRLHGLPESIVSDRDAKFTSKFWRELHRLNGTKLLMSTSFHPQTDGVSERAIRTISQILRGIVKPDQTNWAEKIPLVEFAINSSVSQTTGFAPFELNYGYLPSITQMTNSPIAMRGVQEFAERARDNLSQAHDAIIENRVNQTYFANQARREDPDFKVGDLVYLSTVNLNLPKGRARRLVPKYIGPYPIVEMDRDTSTYKLELSQELRDRRINPTFHVNLIKKHEPNDSVLFPHRDAVAFYDFGDNTETEWFVDEILSHQWVGRSVKFLVKWTAGDTTWEPLNSCKALEALDNYYDLVGVSEWKQLPKRSEKS